MSKKLWGGRFEKETDKDFFEFQKSIGYDYKLAKYDIVHSLIHVAALGKSDILSRSEKVKLIKALKEIRKEIWDIRDIGVISGLTFLTWWTSMTYLPIVVGLTVYVFLKSKHKMQTSLIILAPYLIFVLVLLMTGSLHEWYFANVTYNQNYYIYL